MPNPADLFTRNGLKLSKLSHALPASKKVKAYTVELGFRLIAYRNSVVYLLYIVAPWISLAP